MMYNNNPLLRGNWTRKSCFQCYTTSFADTSVSPSEARNSCGLFRSPNRVDGSLQETRFSRARPLLPLQQRLKQRNVTTAEYEEPPSCRYWTSTKHPFLRQREEFNGHSEKCVEFYTLRRHHHNDFSRVEVDYLIEFLKANLA